MRAACTLVIALAVLGTAHADDPVEAPTSPQPPDAATMTRIRDLHEAKDWIGLRAELLRAYGITPHPSLLFALGQAELNLENFEAAIDYYDRFIATNPPAEQVDLAQQGKGAARIGIANRKPRRHRYWTGQDTALVALGGVAIGTGVGLFAYGRHLGNDHSGSLADYDARTDRARSLQWSGAAAATAGLATIGFTLIRWRLRPEDGEVTATASATGASVTVSGRW